MISICWSQISIRIIIIKVIMGYQNSSRLQISQGNLKIRLKMNKLIDVNNIRVFFILNIVILNSETPLIFFYVRLLKDFSEILKFSSLLCCILSLNFFYLFIFYHKPYSFSSLYTLKITTLAHLFNCRQPSLGCPTYQMVQR